MDPALHQLLLQPDMLGRQGQYVVIDELQRQGDLPRILAKLPLAERLKLYHHLTRDENGALAAHSPMAYHALIASIGASIDLKDKGAWPYALEAAIGRPYMRKRQETSATESDSFDGLQDRRERTNQAYLAHLLTFFLPKATNTSPADCVNARVSDTEKAQALAFLCLERDSPESSVGDALRLVSENFALTPASWAAFVKAVSETVNCPAKYASNVVGLIDKIVGRTIEGLSPMEIENLDEKSAFRYMQALGWSGEITESFRKTQLYFYRHLPPTQTIKARREEQTDRVLDYFSNLSETELDDWDLSKELWSELSPAEKSDYVSKFVSVLGDLIGTPQTPKARVLDWEEATQFVPSKANGYYAGMVYETVDGQFKPVWKNDVILVDSVGYGGRPLSASLSQRSALNSAAHETIHSDDRQIILRFSADAESFDVYRASFGDEPAPSELMFSDPLGYTSAFLTFADSGRASYITAETDAELYRQQPVEKYAWSFQNGFTAALNGTLVCRQVNASSRDLNTEAKELFVQAGILLTQRQLLTQSPTDFTGLATYDQSEHPFGALAFKDDERLDRGGPFSADASSQTFTAADFPKDADKQEVAAFLLKAFERMGQGREQATHEVLPLYRRTADFLVQLSDEIWCIKNNLKLQSPGLEAKLEAFARKTHMLGEDLSDYCFVVCRRHQRDERERSDAALRVERERAASHLASIL